MEEDFCQALRENDRATLKVIVDAKLAAIPPETSMEKSVEEVKTWIESFNCIDQVTILPDLLDTQPPIQEIRIVLKSESDVPVVRIIGIQLFPGKFRFNNK